MPKAFYLILVAALAAGSLSALADERRTVAVIGTGDMGDSLGPKLSSIGYRVVYGSRDPARDAVAELVRLTGNGATATSQREAAESADIVLLAVPWPPMEQVAQNLGDLSGKIVIDVSFPFQQAEDGYPEMSVETSSAELIQQWNPNAKVVKWSLPTAYYIDHPMALGRRPSNWIASDDKAAKEEVAKIAAEIGQDPIDAGPLRLSRALDEQALLFMVPLYQRRPQNWENTSSRSSYWACMWEDDWSVPVADHDDLAQFPPSGKAPAPCSTYTASAKHDSELPYRVEFRNSCDVAVKDQFNHAVTLLHSFEYPEATRLFAKIAKDDPGCAMAHWGTAMSIWHPLWAPPSRSELEAGARILAATDDPDATERERAYLDAIKAFFSSSDTSTHMARARDYEQRMAMLYREHLDDSEAAVFYALAMLATQDPRDKTYAQQFRAAGVLNWVKASEPGHPGVMHYLIHSYDFPGLAHLALDVARTYAEAAPDSAHAQHMPSHIFTRLGLWEESLASNHDSTRSAAEYTDRAKLPGHYDEGLHGIDYLMYAMLQTARDEQARELLQTLANIKKTDTENFKVAYTYAASPARYVLERRAWDEARNLQLIRKDFAWDDFGFARSIHHFARGIGAIRSGDVKGAQLELDAIAAIQKAMPATALPYWHAQPRVQADVIRSWIMFAKGQQDNALTLAAKAADREDAVDKHPVTPGEVLPARELYADMLFEAGRYADAFVQYRRVLDAAPNRLNALLGASRSAAAQGDTLLSRHYDDVIQQQVRTGNNQRRELATILSAVP